jgi:3-hydroxyisobutyrate dehydrogenase
MSKLRYGFVGLGNLGGHLAASLVQNGFDVAVYDRDPTLGERHLALGAERAADPAAAARGRDGVFTCLPSPAASEAVLAQILEGAAPGTTWIECSTLGRDDIRRLAKLAAAREVETLEAPVTGGVHLAARGDITVLAGGDESLFARHEPALRAMGGRLFHMGPLGSAAVIKVITNMLAFIHLVAAGEALMLAKTGGLDLAQSFHAIAPSSGTSFVHETESQIVLNGSYDIGFTMDLALKDLGFATTRGEQFGAPLELAAHVLEIFERGMAAYGGNAWSTQIVKLLEDALKTDLRAPGFPARLT